jgi:hypothetical protein
MAGSKGNGTPGGNVVSRRDAIVGALALAAGALVASKPDAAQAANYEQLTTWGYETALECDTLATGAGTHVSQAVFNRGANFLPDYAVQGVQGLVWPGAPADSSGVTGFAYIPGHVGVYAANNDPTGVGLKVYGKTSFMRSGTGTVAKNTASRTVTVTSGVNSGSKILATLQGNGGTGVYLKYAAMTSATTFKVYLTKACTKAVRFPWMVTD